MASHEWQSSIYLASTCAALRTLTVVLSMLQLRLAESTRLMFVSLLNAVYLLAQLLVALTEYKRFANLAEGRDGVLEAVNVGCGVVVFVVALTSPCGPRIAVEGTENLNGRTVLRNAVGGGSVAQDIWGFLALPVVKKAYTENRIDEDDIPALDYTYSSAVVADEVIRQYRASLAASLAKTPRGGRRTNAVKGRALLSALIRAMPPNSRKPAWCSSIVTFMFYAPKLGMSVLLDGIERYEASLRHALATRPPTPSPGGPDRHSSTRPSSTSPCSPKRSSSTTTSAHSPCGSRPSFRCSSPPSSRGSVASEGSLIARIGRLHRHRYVGRGSGTASSSSQVINLVTTDVNRIFSRIDMYSFGIMGPLEVFIGGYAAYLLLGNGALIGLLVAASCSRSPLSSGNSPNASTSSCRRRAIVASRCSPKPSVPSE